MSEQATIEERLTILEETVVNLQRQINQDQTSDNWLEEVIGSISDESAFLEALEYGKLLRYEDQPFEENNESK